VLSEVRIWNLARDQAQIGAVITANAQGLVAQWQFPENAGNVTTDTTGSYSARLHSVRWVKTPDPGSNHSRSTTTATPHSPSRWPPPTRW
jgi:hypothetical protein